MEYDFHKGDWVLSCAMPYPQYVKIKEEHTDIEIVTDIRDEANDRITTAIIDWEELEPIPIEPAVLEAFGFKQEKENFYRLDTGVRKQYVVVFNIQDKWKCECGNMFGSMEDHPLVSENEVKIVVQNIHEIQHAMRFARITKELEYKEK